MLVRTLLPRTPWATVGSAQLPGLASGCVLPGGSATGTVIQASMLVKAGDQPGKVGAALGTIGLLAYVLSLALALGLLAWTAWRFTAGQRSSA